MVLRSQWRTEIKEWETTSFFYRHKTVRCEASLIILLPTVLLYPDLHLGC